MCGRQWDTRSIDVERLLAAASAADSLQSQLERSVPSQFVTREHFLQFANYM